MHRISCSARWRNILIRWSAFDPNVPEDTFQFKIDIDQKAQALACLLATLIIPLGAAWGGSWRKSLYRRGRVKKVYVMSGSEIPRMLPDDINDWYVRGSDGQMVPFSAFSSRWEYGSPCVWNAITVCLRWKFWVRRRRKSNTGEAMAMMRNPASKPPSGIGYD